MRLPDYSEHASELTRRKLLALLEQYAQAEKDICDCLEITDANPLEWLPEGLVIFALQHAIDDRRRRLRELQPCSQIGGAR